MTAARETSDSTANMKAPAPGAGRSGSFRLHWIGFIVDVRGAIGRRKLNATSRGREIAFLCQCSVRRQAVLMLWPFHDYIWQGDVCELSEPMQAESAARGDARV